MSVAPIFNKFLLSLKTKGIVIFWKLLKRSFEDFAEMNSLKLSASLSYYTIFSLAPLLIIVISVTGIFFGVDAVQGKIYNQINGLVGNEASIQIQAMIKNIETSQNSRGGVIIGSIILLVGATGIFTEIQGSINYLWSVKPRPKRGWIKIILDRLLSFSLVAGFSFLLLASLLANSILDVMSDHLKIFFAETTIYLFYGINTVVILVVTSCMFAIIFKVLPDAKVDWKDSLIGAVLTSLLFTGGKLLIGMYVNYSNVGTLYGATASIIVILLWIYYSSIILYFGASFTKQYAMLCGGKITPKNNAVMVTQIE